MGLEIGGKVHGIGAILVSNWEENMLYNKNYQKKLNQIPKIPK